MSKTALPQSFKLLDDNKTEIKLRSEKLLRRIFGVLGQQVFDACPTSKLPRVTGLCGGGPPAKGSMGAGATGQPTTQSSATTSKKEFGTGTFGANGNQLQLNIRSDRS